MIFVINDLKYDTDKMELISEKCEYVCLVLNFVVTEKMYKFGDLYTAVGCLPTIGVFRPHMLRH